MLYSPAQILPLLLQNFPDNLVLLIAQFVCLLAVFREQLVTILSFFARHKPYYTLLPDFHIKLLDSSSLSPEAGGSNGSSINVY